jgi:predicted permease
MAFLQDLRFGFRALTKSPAYTLVAIATLALAIGANTVIFSFANILVLKPLPLRDPDGLAWVFSTDPHSGPRGRSSFADYQSLRDRAQTLESLAATTDDNVTLTGRGEPMRLYARRVTGNFFDVWGLRPAAGRLLRAGEDEPGGACTIVLSDHLWASLFQRDPSIVSTSLAIDGRSCIVAGVVEPAIEIGNLTLIDVWMPISADALRAKRDVRNFAVFGRMKPGATVDQVGADLRAIAEDLQREHPDTNTGWTTRTVNTKTAIMGENSWLIFGLLFVVVGFVLLIACANIANLMLARATGRRRELAVRVALGATRWVVVRQLVTESLLLGIAAGVLGLGVADAGLRLIRAAAYEPFFALVVIDRQVLGFALVLSVVAPLVFSTLPALHAASDAFAAGLREGGRSGSTALARRSRNALIVAQVSLAIVLLVVAGLIVRTMIALNRIDLGFDPKPMLTAQLELPEWKFTTDADVARFYERLVERVNRMPGVAASAAVTGLPSLAPGTRIQFDIADRRAAAAADRPWARRFAATDGYLSAAGIVLLQGRWFTRVDATGTPRVVVVNVEAARRYWQTADRAIGSRIAIGSGEAAPAVGARGGGAPRAVEEAPWAEVVGVVANVANPDLESAPDPYVYESLAQKPARAAAFVVRTPRPADLIPQLRTAVRETNGDVPLFQVRPMQIALDDAMSSNLVLSSLFVAFAALALVLATAGLYGVISFVVGQRTQEIGVRVALGAVPSDIRRLVFGQGLGVVAIGTVLGLAGAAVLARTLSAILYGVTPFDPLTYGGVVFAVFTSAVGAMWVPARRAMRLDPVRSLRAE